MDTPPIIFSDHARRHLFPRAVMRIEIGALRDSTEEDADGPAVEAEIDEIIDDFILNEPTRHRKRRVLPGATFGDAVDRLTAHYPRSVRRLTLRQWLRAVFTGRYRP